jgi:hypothetical protein
MEAAMTVDKELRRMRAQGELGRWGEEIVRRVERGESMQKIAQWYCLDLIKNSVPWSQLTPFEQAFDRQIKAAYEQWRRRH